MTCDEIRRIIVARGPDAAYRALERLACGEAPLYGDAPPAPVAGPGTELMKLIEGLKLDMGPGCQCKARARKMNGWGSEGCRRNRATIIDWLKESANKTGWWDWTKAGYRLSLQPWFKVTDPFGGMVDEAIRRAEQTPGTPEIASGPASS